VDTAELKRRHEQVDVASWLEDEFIDDPMYDSDICTESVDIDNWETLPNK
jgi:CYTH domain-containing protein